MLLPGVTFALLYAWPFLEARFTRDDRPHHLLDRARDHPMRTALGATALAFYGVMFVAASNDLIAVWLRMSVLTMTWIFRVLLIVLPPLVGYVTYRLMKALARSGAERLSEMPLAALGYRHHEERRAASS